jgi:transcriptional regulator with PAS, ATPase and Fis domain
MEDLKVENARLQRLVDVLDSQPELVFAVNKFGRITYMSERTSIYLKSSEDSDEDATHVNQILSPDSVDAVMDAIRQITEESKSSDHDTTGVISSVKVR